MTEEEWVAAEHPMVMLDHLDLIDAITDRKQRLLDCACVLRIWHLLTDLARSVVATAESYADVQAELDEMIELRGEVLSAVDTEIELNIQAANTGVPRHIGNPNRSSALSAAAGVAWEYRGGTNPLGDVVNAMIAQGGLGDERADHELVRQLRFAELRHQIVLVREVFGNPFRPVEFSRDWLTDTAVLLARTMYEAREFGAMPILADALQDAGCDNDDILDHCRGPGPHVRGCWVVDLILGKG